ncbi:cytochrome-c oxidase [Methylobacterium currus]|uniref:cytochrome-c oxidase n=1 Tax=Methylobacterium currus TaxID=2051553 RepID=UPI001E4E2930|nr:cytochrome-c oxidase [Methylobacterium currus]UHC14308.1 cytochrome-c oxidase [Methylobacterium currus]
MSLVLVYLAGLGALSGRWLARQHLAAKPWLSAGPLLSRPAAGEIEPTARLGLGAFLAVIGLLFALLVAAYGMRVPPGSAGVPLDPRLLWLTTGFLGLASLLLHRAERAARRGAEADARANLLAAAAASLVFLGGQGLAWRLIWEAGAGRTVDAAGSFFVLITLLHGLHLAGGLAALARIACGAARTGSPAGLARSIGLCTLYWDALLVIWLVAFGILFRTPWSGLIDVLCRPPA